MGKILYISGEEYLVAFFQMLVPPCSSILINPAHLFVGGRWHKRHLTYRVVNWPGHIPLGQVALAVRKAFQLWSNVSALTFREVTQGSADIRLAFYEGEHNDGMGNTFDGPGGTLAHRWTLNSYKGHNLFMVIAHEVGHSPVRHALMSPYISPGSVGNGAIYCPFFQLPGQVFSSTVIYSDTCKASMLYYLADQDGTSLVFRGRLFWTVSPAGQASSPLPLQNRWPGLPLAIEAAAYSKMDNKLYFFKGSLIQSDRL
uniref:Matrix metallopeptidase 28 n=1 Tax=Hucho hucho TaxID=62062 RepID=A0A4W5N813_9TELE